MNNELIERIDQAISDLADDIELLEACDDHPDIDVQIETIGVLRDCKAALAQQQEAEPVVDDKFVRAWIKLDKFPGIMMNGPDGIFGPIPATTTCRITTSERELACWDSRTEVYLNPPKHTAQPADIDADELSNFIRKIDGNNSMGAGALAENIVEWIGKQATQPQVLEVGIRGKAYDPPKTCRAYTYKEQPDNVGAWRLGEAVQGCNSVSSGDLIDVGLGLLNHLEKHGFGVYELSAAKEQS